jgi:hypothetical protein
VWSQEKGRRASFGAESSDDAFVRGVQERAGRKKKYTIVVVYHEEPQQQQQQQ